ncbi:MAG TPA: hypothetical protein PLI99_01075 [archaeon]|nr:hypothetical protein [archaeon]
MSKERDLLKTERDSLKDASIRDGINSGAININLENIGNIDGNFASTILDASCKEKDFIISELADKINSQNKGLIICQQDNNVLKSQVNDLQKMIPAYEKGFVGKEIVVGVNSTFIADSGNFTLAVFDTENVDSVDRHWTDFVLNGVGHRLNIGGRVQFFYFDSNYDLTLIQSGNPSKFSIAKVN